MIFKRLRKSFKAFIDCYKGKLVYPRPAGEQLACLFEEPDNNGRTQLMFAVKRTSDGEEVVWAEPVKEISIYRFYVKMLKKADKSFGVYELRLVKK